MSDTDPLLTVAFDSIRESDSTAPPLLIVGASARAAAFSALRSGMQVTCLDRFADIDLQQVAEVRQISNYPDGLIGELGQLSRRPVMYTGALENHHDVIRAIESGHWLLGNGADTLLHARAPQAVCEVLKRFHVPHLKIRTHREPPPADGQWLLKPLHGAAGRGITVWDEHAATSPTLDEAHYFQRKAEGETFSAVFLAQKEPFQCRYVGLTRQLIGLPELNAPQYRWCGAIGPLVLDTSAEILIRRTGNVLARQFGLQGLFGCDFILDPQTRPLMTEVNPRYTSSVEVLELLAEVNLVRDHCEAMGYQVSAEESHMPLTNLPPVIGKAVVFADRELLVPANCEWICTSPQRPLPGHADIPQPGSVIPAGGPICSILTGADSTDDCLSHLLQRAAQVLLMTNCESASPQSLENLDAKAI